MTVAYTVRHIRTTYPGAGPSRAVRPPILVARGRLFARRRHVPGVLDSVSGAGFTGSDRRRSAVPVRCASHALRLQLERLQVLNPAAPNASASALRGSDRAPNLAAAASSMALAVVWALVR